MTDDYAKLWLRLAELRIMVVAQNPWIKDSLVKYFKSNGCEAYAFESGSNAQKGLAEKPFDIVIADFSLSDMSGLEFLQQSLSFNPKSINMLICPADPENIPPEATRIGIRIIEKPLRTDAIDEAFLKVMKEQEKTSIDR